MAEPLNAISRSGTCKGNLGLPVLTLDQKTRLPLASTRRARQSLWHISFHGMEGHPSHWLVGTVTLPTTAAAFLAVLVALCSAWAPISHPQPASADGMGQTRCSQFAAGQLDTAKLATGQLAAGQFNSSISII